jgi:hypothetical protein
VLENNMTKAAAFFHKPKSSDFLLIIPSLKKDNPDKSWVLKPI